MRTLQTDPLESFCVLPGGLFRDGCCLRDVKLRSPTGRLEEQIAEASDSLPLASAVTTLLVHCIEQIGQITEVTPQIVRALLVGDRDYLVLKLRQITFGNKVEGILACPNVQCGERIDIDFSLECIPIKEGKISSQFFTVRLPDGSASETGDDHTYREVQFRLPNGEDQENLALLAAKKESEAYDKLLVRCIQRIDGTQEIDESLIGTLSDAWRGEIEEAMAELAPQVDLELEAKCPECSKTFSFPFNISQFFFDEMKCNQDQLYEEVHTLAFYYKWSESDILSMIRSKRRRYLELLRKQLEKECIET